MAQQRRFPWESLRTALATSGVLGLVVVTWFRYGWNKWRRPLKGSQHSNAASLGEELRKALLDELDEKPLDELQEDFTRASAYVGASSSLSNKSKLELYGCYKQVMCGDCTQGRPWGMEASMKWEAWHQQSGASKADAMRRYILALDEAVPAWRMGEQSTISRPRHAGPKEGSGPTTGPTVSLLQCIGDPEQANDVDATPIGQLCEKIAKDETDAAKEILSKTPDFAVSTDKDGMTPLHWACDRGCIGMVQFLLELGMNNSTVEQQLNARDGSGDTPLHFAVLTDNLEIAKLLLECRADPNVKNGEGDSAMDIADGEDWRKALVGAV